MPSWKINGNHSSTKFVVLNSGDAILNVYFKIDPFELNTWTKVTNNRGVKKIDLNCNECLLFYPVF